MAYPIKNMAEMGLRARILEKQGLIVKLVDQRERTRIYGDSQLFVLLNEVHDDEIEYLRKDLEEDLKVLRQLKEEQKAAAPIPKVLVKTDPSYPDQVKAIEEFNASLKK